MRYALGIIAALALCVTANAQNNTYNPFEQLSAKYILAACKQAPTESQFLIGVCLGQIQMLYTLAYIDGLGRDKRFCPPPRGISVMDTRDVVVRYIENRPELMFTPFAFLAIDALKKEWPCP
jgi:hypothetical protein